MSPRDGDDLDDFGIGVDGRVGNTHRPSGGDVITDARPPLDKSLLPPGPWRTEPDYREWLSKALFTCFIERNNLGAWCGYVEVPKGHPWHGAQPNAQVHGGVTYAETDVDKGRPDRGRWVVGFDCGHGGDLIPAFQHLSGRVGRPTTYRDIDYVVLECEALAQQALTEGPP
jgi:hypothetical protein